MSVGVIKLANIREKTTMFVHQTLFEGNLVSFFVRCSLQNSFKN
eukprot:UN18682